MCNRVLPSGQSGHGVCHSYLAFHVVQSLETLRAPCEVATGCASQETFACEERTCLQVRCRMSAFSLGLNACLYDQTFRSRYLRKQEQQAATGVGGQGPKRTYKVSRALCDLNRAFNVRFDTCSSDSKGSFRCFCSCNRLHLSHKGSTCRRQFVQHP